MSSSSSAASYSMGIDDAVLLMTSVVIENMINLGEGRHSTVISNDRFQDYAYGTRLNFAEIEHENTEEYMRTPEGQEWARHNPVYTPERLRGLAPSPFVGRLISLEGEETREYFQTKFDSDTGVVLVRRQPGPYTPAGPDHDWLPLNESGLFFRECLALLRSKLTGFSGKTDFARGLQQVVFELSNEIAKSIRNSDIAYLVDVENMFHLRYGDFELRFKRILPVLNKYFRRRYAGELMWGRDGNTGEGDPASVGQRVVLVLPVYENKRIPMIRALQAVLGQFDDLVYNIMVVPFNIDFFNTLARRGVTPTTRASTPFTPVVPSPRGTKRGGGAAGGGKRRKMGLHDMFASLRF